MNRSSYRQLERALYLIFGQKVSDGVEIDVTNEELANSVAISHFTVSRVHERVAEDRCDQQAPSQLASSVKTAPLRIIEPGLLLYEETCRFWRMGMCE